MVKTGYIRSFNLILNILVVVCLVAPNVIRSQIQLSHYFSNHMVLQRDKPIRFWGSANPGSDLIVRFAEKTIKAKSSDNGHWEVTFPSMSVSGPFQLSVESSKDRLTLKDILIGDVWLCSGQSNMQFPLSRSSEANDIPVKHKLKIRLLKLERRSKLGPVAFTKEEMELMGKSEFFKIQPWQVLGPETAADFSAVAFHFGNLLYDSLKIPIGLIQNAVGGSTIESWISRDSINSSVDFQYLQHADWYQHSSIHPWVKGRVRQNLQPWLETGDTTKSMIHPFAPGYLYRNGIESLVPISIRGVIWYQGESNATSPASYKKLFEMMIACWRTSFNEINLPFYFVQLPRIGNRSRWPEFRSQQEACLEFPGTGMVVTIDQGHLSDVHPREKKVIGERLARLALEKCYGFVCTPPTPSSESGFPELHL